MKNYYVYDATYNYERFLTEKELTEMIGWSKNKITHYVNTLSPVSNTTLYITTDKIPLEKKKSLYSNVKLDGEVFKEIEGSSGTYFISNKGRCKHSKGHFLMPVYRKRGEIIEAGQIHVVFLSVTKKYSIAHLVAHHFIRPKKKNEIVTHRNRQRVQCEAENLIYTSRAELMGLSNKHRYLVQQICPQTKQIVNEFTKKQEAIATLRISEWHFSRCLQDENFDPRFKLRKIKSTPTFYV